MIKIVNAQNQRKRPDSNGNSYPMQKIGDIDVEIDGKPIYNINQSEINGYIFDDIKDIESKLTEILSILNIVNQRLNTLESRVGALETN
jgi:hypothetical protein